MPWLASFVVRLPASVRSAITHTLPGFIIGNELRVSLWRSLGAHIDEGVLIEAGCHPLRDIHLISIGTGTLLNGATLYAWAPIRIGKHVLLSPESVLQTGSHELDSRDFRSRWKPIIIEDHVWIAQGAMILQGVTIGTGGGRGAGGGQSRRAILRNHRGRQPGTRRRERRQRDFAYRPPPGSSPRREWLAPRPTAGVGTKHTAIDPR